VLARAERAQIPVWGSCAQESRNGGAYPTPGRASPRVCNMHSNRSEFLEKCRLRASVNPCLCCPARAQWQGGYIDGWYEYFCQLAHARADAMWQGSSTPG